ncbi:hypothetical protein [Rheinheimera hassiensis]|uniref:hypothetical protein n=1 Tax=Rheinheimera hassiensis TaxID=1193627 RepID=UPI001F062963|nr:hypothetical protein [Rheinheimera hassiensis]
MNKKNLFMPTAAMAAQLIAAPAHAYCSTLTQDMLGFYNWDCELLIQGGNASSCYAYVVTIDRPYGWGTGVPYQLQIHQNITWVGGSSVTRLVHWCDITSYT